MNVELWDVFEASFAASKTYSNPFRDIGLEATFVHAGSGREIAVDGFYDGDSTWRVRFMPTERGAWKYKTKSKDKGLDGKEGGFDCVAPSKPYLHGPLLMDGYHFRHADGTPRFLISTRLTCHFGSPSVWEKVVDFLVENRINRVFFMMGGRHGTFESFYGEGGDFWRYNVEKFQAIDRFIDTLRRADIIASPYFYYFNDGVQRKLTLEQDMAYIRYGMARFGAYANAFPALSNEVEQKFTERRGQYDLRSHSWANEVGYYLAGRAVFGVPVTVHNPEETEYAINPSFYTLLREWPFPWTSCMLRQMQVGTLGAAKEISDSLPEQKTPVYDERAFARHNQLLIDLRQFGIPVINEEPGYEMKGLSWDSKELNPRPWNTQTSETLLRTFWTATVAGAYTMWGSETTYEMGDPLPGMKRSKVPAYIRILHDFIARLPYWEMYPVNKVVSPNEVAVDGVPYRTNFCMAKPGETYIVYSLNGGSGRIGLPPGKYDFSYLNPRTGEEKSLDEAEGGKFYEFSVPAGDGVLLFQRAK
jgi:hypothetical protein